MQADEQTGASPGTILFVDDEREILKALQRAMRSENYHCVFASSGKEALKLLENHPVQVMVTDMRMPEMPGQELLAHVARSYPQVVRLVLSGWSNSDTILQAINSGQIYRYIVKPWDDRELKITIRQALEVFRLQQQKRILLAQLEAQNRRLEQLVEQRTQQLLKIRSQAEIGKYASEIVHNLNNPLHALDGSLDLIALIISHDDGIELSKLSKAVAIARRGAGDLKRIVSGILQHVRDQRIDRIESVNLNSLIEQEMDFYELDQVFRRSIQKKLQLAPDLPPLSGNPIQFKQVIDNLVSNAIDAMQHAPVKELTVRTACEDDTILLEIGDTGEGIPEENLPHIFSPDFSTKPPGKGTGLGLASVKTMVEAYAGNIHIHTQPGQGTTFSVRLPLVRKQ